MNTYDPFLFDIHFSEIKMLAKLAFEINRKSRIYDIDEIVNHVSDFYQISKENMMKNTRKREIVLPRQTAMFFAKRLTKLSLQHIGNEFGKKDHATVLHACRTISNLIETDSKIRDDMNTIFQNINYYSAIKSNI